MLERVQAKLREVRCVSVPVDPEDSAHVVSAISKDVTHPPLRDLCGRARHDARNRLVVRFVEPGEGGVQPRPRH